MSGPIYIYVYTTYELSSSQYLKAMDLVRIRAHTIVLISNPLSKLSMVPGSRMLTAARINIRIPQTMIAGIER